ncbi:MAG TPA: thioesterase family protein [Saprospiraceae bacterium]|nr:thioesterase family protein [Saprospiraceae bacterium]
MYTSDTQIRVRYSETDQMNFVYYGHYASYFEVGRVEALRQLGLSYAALERDYGILLPVMNMHVRFVRPALYDEQLTIITTVPRLPARDILFITEIVRTFENGKTQLIAGSRIALCFLEAGTRKRLDAPGFLKDKLQPYF